jgi:hypothetical protein
VFFELKKIIIFIPKELQKRAFFNLADCRILNFVQHRLKLKNFLKKYNRKTLKTKAILGFF